MKINLICFLFSVLVTNFAQSQTKFIKLYGDSMGESIHVVQQTSDGGFVLAGLKDHHITHGNTDIYLIETNQNGDLQWTKTYGGVDYEQIYDVNQNSDGGYILAGSTASFGAGNRDAFLIRTDQNGDTIWTKSYGSTGGDEPFYAHQTIDGGFIFLGNTSGVGPVSFSGIYFLKTDAAGNKEWMKVFNNSGEDMDAASARQTPDGGYIIGGTIYLSTNGGQSDFFLMKLDSNINVQWTNTYGGIEDEYDGYVCLNNEGGYYFSGVTESFGAAAADIYIGKVDSVGNLLWAKVVGGYSHEEMDGIQSITETSDGGVVFLGMTLSFGFGSRDGYLVKIDNNGNLLWSKALGWGSDDRFYSITETSDNGLLAVGFLAGAVFRHALLIKTDQNGDNNCKDTIVTSSMIVPVTILGSVVVVSDTLALVLNNTNPLVSSLGTDSTLCTAVGIPEYDLNIKMLDAYFYTNSNQISISISSLKPEQPYLMISDLAGRILFKSKISISSSENTLNIEVGNLASSIYMITLIGNDGRISKKVIKE